MRVISNKALTDFAQLHPQAGPPMQAWRKTIETNAFLNSADLKKAFNATDRAKGFCIFDTGGNKFRIVAAIHFNAQKLFVRHVFTHEESDAWNR